MRRQHIPVYGVVVLALYVLTTSDIYISREVGWFLYFVLIPATIGLSIMAFLNIRQERKGVVI